MWVSYKHNSNGKVRKFNLPSDKPVSPILEDCLSGQFCWQIDDKKYIKQEAKEEVSKLQLAGYAVLIEDPSGKIKYWATFNGEGKEHVNLSPAQPLLFPTGKLKTGTRVELHIPKD